MNNRITPACAGKTGCCIYRKAFAEDHPRVCGENCCTLSETSFAIGSPPRVRGKLEIPRRAHPRPGITPACAGKTFFPYDAKVLDWDHPRVCGENLPLPVHLTPYRGSPPRVRGKLYNGRVVTLRARITPACAGKTHRKEFFMKRIQDHPRVCGENTKNGTEVTNCKGSPPRVRGKRNMLEFPIGLFRITPACAGKTENRCIRKIFIQDHPRVCGENLLVLDS